VPHNSPMWRKEMHMRLGGFRPRDNRRGCYDFSFWTRAMREGHKFRHLNEPLEMYLRRETSHGHRTHAYAGAGASPKRRTWVNECDTPEEWALSLAHVRRAVWEAYGWKIRNTKHTEFSTWAIVGRSAFLIGCITVALSLLPLLRKHNVASLPPTHSSWMCLGWDILRALLPALLVLLLFDPRALLCKRQGICHLIGPVRDFQSILIHAMLAGAASVACALLPYLHRRLVLHDLTLHRATLLAGSVMSTRSVLTWSTTRPQRTE